MNYSFSIFLHLNTNTTKDIKNPSFFKIKLFPPILHQSPNEYYGVKSCNITFHLPAQFF